ncbi:ureidoglycolate lyase [Rhodovulum sp. DZ06]|uniref:ureidoglycolate lyase n=1 Tax=Rhodovulum sp. DZ06 TaxID=3425126 RepID=UPI003D332582
MSRTIPLLPLTEEAFAPFGEIIAKRAEPSFPINGGMCDRHHALAVMDLLGEGARGIISIGHGRPYPEPLEIGLVERHPLGSQAWIPLHDRPFAVVAAPDEGGRPGTPVAFLTAPRQGVNYRAGVWHAPLRPLGAAGDFLIVDRDGPGENLEEYTYDSPWIVTTDPAG